MTVPVSLDVLTGIAERNREYRYHSIWTRTIRIRSIPRQASGTGCRNRLGNPEDLRYPGQGDLALFEGTQDAGYYTAEWDGRNGAGTPMASGIYFYRLEAARHPDERYVSMKKMVLMK